MACFHPISAYRVASGGIVFAALSRHDIVAELEVPCGRCIGCRMRRASDWTLRCMHEASLHEENCFVTLTYGRDKMPAHGSLDHDDFAKFMKRLRKQVGPVRFYMCGEYGPVNLRPHYHACIFGHGFLEDRVKRGQSRGGFPFFEQRRLSALWPHGFATVQDLTPETAGYCAKYVMKKALGADAEAAYRRVDSDGVSVDVRPEYAAMSLKPGIGAEWYRRFRSDVLPRDFAVDARGIKHSVPKYYNMLARREGFAPMDDVEFRRQVAAKSRHADNTDERLRVREEVMTARFRLNARDL